MPIEYKHGRTAIKELNEYLKRYNVKPSEVEHGNIHELNGKALEEKAEWIKESCGFPKGLRASRIKDAIASLLKHGDPVTKENIMLEAIDHMSFAELDKIWEFSNKFNAANNASSDMQDSIRGRLAAYYFNMGIKQLMPHIHAKKAIEDAILTGQVNNLVQEEMHKKQHQTETNIFFSPPNSFTPSKIVSIDNTSMISRGVLSAGSKKKKGEKN